MNTIVISERKMGEGEKGEIFFSCIVRVDAEEFRGRSAGGIARAVWSQIKTLKDELKALVGRETFDRPWPANTEDAKAVLRKEAEKDKNIDERPF